MPSLTIDAREITPDLLRPEDSPVLTDAVLEANGVTQPILDGTGFENRF
ncbi:hypothetical protein [Actinomadura bangladeshensis]|nr:hypothetical protein [Actinomadura bangladeshensis]